MYSAGFLIFLVFLIVSTCMTGSGVMYLDIPSLSIISIFSISLLMASGLLSDFLRGFKIMGQKENTYSIIELKKTEEAIKLMIKLLLLSGLLGSLIALIAILAIVGDDIIKLGPYIAIALITPFYSILCVLILLPIKSKVKAVLMTID